MEDISHFCGVIGNPALTSGDNSSFVQVYTLCFCRHRFTRGSGRCAESLQCGTSVVRSEPAARGSVQRLLRVAPGTRAE